MTRNKYADTQMTRAWEERKIKMKVKICIRNHEKKNGLKKDEGPQVKGLSEDQARERKKWHIDKLLENLRTSCKWWSS